MENYDNLIYMAMNDDGKYTQDIYGDVACMCGMLEHIIAEIYKVIYFSTDMGDVEQSKQAIDTLQTVYFNALKRATNDIDNGEEVNAYYDI